jgi:hypothetical protein
MKKKNSLFSRTAAAVCFVFVAINSDGQTTNTEVPIIFLETEDFLENLNEASVNLNGFLEANKDVFLKTAAFSFGQARFKIRGYNSEENTLSINGIPMNKLRDGRPQWSNWGGLNDVFRNQLFSNGIAASETSFGALAGTRDYVTRASQYRKGSSVSFGATNGSYRTRIMASYFSGLQKKGWAIAASLSNRSAEEGFIQGTPYKAWAAFLSVEKKWNAKHSLNFTAFYTPNRRGKNAPITDEVFRIKGSRYNPYWGFQDEMIRNSRMKEVSEPVLMLTHYWGFSERLKLETTVFSQFGKIADSRLGYQKSAHPDPTYYKKMPSYFLRNTDGPNFRNAYLARKELEENGQINWRELYEINVHNQQAYYYLYEDVKQENSFQIRTQINYRINPKTTYLGTFFFQKSKSTSFARIQDLLGGKGVFDLDYFAEGRQRQPNLLTPDRWVTRGGIVKYHYQMLSNLVSHFSQINYSSSKIEGFVAFRLKQVSYQRFGIFQNGQFPENSYGKGVQNKFSSTSLKAGLLYKISGNHLVNLNGGVFSQIPFLNEVYSNSRINHNAVPDIENEKKIAGELSYLFRNPRINSKITLYGTRFFKSIENSFAYADGIRGKADFVSMLLTNIEKKHVGLEWGLEVGLSNTFQLNTVVALGSFTYANAPNMYVESDQFQGANRFIGKSFLKGYKLGGTPEKAYSIGIQYNDPKYWWVGLNANYLTDNFIQISPLLRTKNFYLDSYGIPFNSEVTGEQISNKEIGSLLRQEKLSPPFLVNLVGGKSWKWNAAYLSLFLSANNLFGTVYKTGGFEQSRNANYPGFYKDRKLEFPLFGSKYWFGKTASYFLILSYRF